MLIDKKELADLYNAVEERDKELERLHEMLREGKQLLIKKGA